MKRIAVITGASSGMGRRFAETANEFGQFDEIWAVARREDKLKELSASAPFPVKPVTMDLSDPASAAKYEALLKKTDVEVGLLVNASGFGKFQAVMDVPAEENLNMIDVTCSRHFRFRLEVGASCSTASSG